ncbi:MAG TPA: hypothetical protein VFJ64_10835 [Solirubrobacterales bacterium]|nr:hypothetical protein [Solirubrobacterales bacterium]
MKWTCKACGCTNSEPCFTSPAGKVRRFAEIEQMTEQELAVVDVGDPCHWIEPDLCSACVVDRAPPLLFDAYGKPVPRGAP